MTDTHPRADGRRGTLVDEVASRFDSQLLGDIIRDKLQYGDNSILQMVDVTERCYALEEGDILESEAAQKAAFRAAEELYEAESQEVEARVMVTLQAVVDDREEIEGFHGDDVAAVDEAEQILEQGELPPADGQEVSADA